MSSQLLSNNKLGKIAKEFYKLVKQLLALKKS